MKRYVLVSVRPVFDKFVHKKAEKKLAELFVKGCPCGTVSEALVHLLCLMYPVGEYDILTGDEQKGKQ